MSRPFRFALPTWICLTALSVPVPSGATETSIQQWELGMVVRSPGLCTGVVATLPIPMDWPEQRVQVLDESHTSQVSALRYRTLGEGVRQLVISIPRLEPGDEAEVRVRLQVARRPIRAPREPHSLQIPERIPRELRTFMGNSPLIETTHPQIRQLADQLVQEEVGAWQQVEAIYDWVWENIEYEFDEQLQGALAALQTRRGDCEERTSLFIALCRNMGVPARSVWVPGHCYPEFYLEDSSGRGHWFPCQSAGVRQFGAMDDLRPILQKGDEFRVPGEGAPQRYVSETFRARHATVNPQVEFIRRQLD